MRPKRYPKQGNKSISETNSHIHYDKLNVRGNSTFKKALSDQKLSFFDLPSLQIETEKIMSQLGYRLRSLAYVLNGKPNGDTKCIKANESTNESSICPNIETQSDKTSKELVVKSIPDKPLTLIIAQNRSGKRRNSFGEVGNKRNASIEDNINDIASTSTPKRKKPNSPVCPLFENISPIKKENDDLTLEIKTDTKTPNYEIPNKFWELMEPYCAEINDEHIKTLENMIEAYENDAHYYEVPDVSNFPHLTNGITSRRQSNHEEDIKKHLNGFVENKNGIDLTNLLKKIDTELRKPLSQTSSLYTFPSSVVEKLTQENEKEINNCYISKTNSTLNTEITQSSKLLAKQLKVSNTFKLERHLKKSMDDLGICNLNLPFILKPEPHVNLNKLPAPSLDTVSSTLTLQEGISKSSEADIIDPVILNHSDYVEVSLPIPSADCKQEYSISEINNKQQQKRKMDVNVKEDKVTGALERRQAELRLVSESNLGMLRRLLMAAKRDMKRQEIQRKLAVADADVIEAYNIIESYRPTHRQPLKKDRDAAYKALRERQKILKELELFDSDFL